MCEQGRPYHNSRGPPVVGGHGGYQGSPPRHGRGGNGGEPRGGPNGPPPMHRSVNYRGGGGGRDNIRFVKLSATLQQQETVRSRLTAKDLI